ncbi:MAG: PAS domain S-box protein [Fluviicoccus sp.]|uniref:PAS domain S-box protein n=1 Tax=Fluviicoccus sp. TaxID=2003552 RepID=UPI0027187E4C|nr:PAS domain S-box protein [Fluviicoccus sp.]MDO8330582.1 PAS domain S-box protein [Fluviicoccus sp.]
MGLTSDGKLPPRLWTPLLRASLVPILLIGLCLWARTISQPLFHTLAELLSVIIALTALMVASTSLVFTRNHFIVWIAVGTGWSAMLDLAHTLSYPPLGLIPVIGPGPSLQLWELARFIQALALISAPVFLYRRVTISLTHSLFALASVSGFWLVTSTVVPICLSEGQCASSKSGLEILTILMLLTALGLLCKERKLMPQGLCLKLGLSILAMLLSGLSFSLFREAGSPGSLIGHLLKFLADWLIYLALVQGALREPFTLLARTASSYDTVPDPTLTTDSRGIILQVNRAAARSRGLPAERLVGSHAHPLFHNPAVGHLECPICARMARGDRDFMDGILILRDKTVLECSLAPVDDGNDQIIYVQVIRDVTERQRLAYLYEMLSATNRAIVHSHTVDELLTALYEAMIAHQAYPKLFIARTETGEMPMQVVRSHAINADGLAILALHLADHFSQLGRQMAGFMKGGLMCSALPDPGVDPTADDWTAYLYAAGIRSQAILPLVCHGRLFAIIGLYTDNPAGFDPSERRLLDEMTADMTFSLNAMLVEERRRAAEQQASESEFRFNEVFASSPMPMNILSGNTGDNLAVNPAFTHWLGYELNDLWTIEDCLAKIVVNRDHAEDIWDRWQQQLQTSTLNGAPLLSDEMTIRAKDGSLHSAWTNITRVGSDVILAWVDLTDIRRGESALRESEQRFRGMIENTVSGITVRRDDKFVYANPRFCAMTGWSPEELTGHPILEFIPEPDDQQRLREIWRQQAARTGGTAYTTSFRRKDGAVIQLGLHASPIDWDGLPGTIVMVEDITERQRIEAQNAQYVTRLEASMKGTMLAVSNMVELRDPYTAGHERRVGLIAGALGRKLGWSPERCADLEMIGLVHDIGKIAVPSELLTKPSRLSAMEMALIRGHAKAGYDILRDIPFPTPVAEIIYQHHERMDGSGYPRGLKGDEILPEARILAVADVVESMASHRPYRPALGLDAALAELIRGRDTIYDAPTVDAMLDLVQHDHYTLPD